MRIARRAFSPMFLSIHIICTSLQSGSHLGIYVFLLFFLCVSYVFPCVLLCVCCFSYVFPVCCYVFQMFCYVFLMFSYVFLRISNVKTPRTKTATCCYLEGGWGGDPVRGLPKWQGPKKELIGKPTKRKHKKTCVFEVFGVRISSFLPQNTFQIFAKFSNPPRRGSVLVLVPVRALSLRKCPYRVSHSCKKQQGKIGRKKNRHIYMKKYDKYEK